MIIKDNKTELYHSGIYLGKDYSEGIKHYKYIKKERKNGRWVYYYSDRDRSNAERNASEAESAYVKNFMDREVARSKYKKAYNDENKYYNKRLITDDPNSEMIYRGKQAAASINSENYGRQYLQTYDKESKLYDKYNKAHKKWVKEEIKSRTIGNAAKILIGGLNAISYGKQKVGKALSKLGKLFKR